MVDLIRVGNQLVFAEGILRQTVQIEIRGKSVIDSVTRRGDKAVSLMGGWLLRPESVGVALLFLQVYSLVGIDG